MYVYPILIIAGFGTGFLSGLLGIGGGIIFVPLLLFILPLLGIENDLLIYSAIATSLFAGTLSALSSSYSHYQRKNITLRNALYLGGGATIAGIIIPQFISYFNPTFLKIVFVTVLIFSGIKMFFGNKIFTNPDLKIKDYFLTFIGIVIGGLSSLTGLGGGILFVPSLIGFMNSTPGRAVGTSSLAVALTMFVASFSFAFVNVDIPNSIGYINYSAGIPLGVFAIVGAQYGVKFHSRISQEKISQIFSVLILLAILKIIFS